GGLDSGANTCHHLLLRRRLGIEAGVLDAVAAAEINLGDRNTSIAQLCRKIDNGRCCGTEPGRVEDLAADMGVQAKKLQVGILVDRRHNLLRCTGGERKAELLILVSSGDELVPARMNT